MSRRTLLGPNDPQPVRAHPAIHASPFVLVSDHAGRAVPLELGDLGVHANDWERHIAWDIGIAGVGYKLRDRLGATLIEQTYSRLVIDCNRAPGHPTSVVVRSDGTEIPLNAQAAEACHARRAHEILHPYHGRIAEELDARDGEPTALIALHSFTPTMDGIARPWQIGLLHNRDSRLTTLMLALLEAEGDLCVGDNQPYVLTDTSDYTVPLHAEARGLPYLEVEIRQDLIANAAGQDAWADRLARLLPIAWARFCDMPA